MSDTALQRLFDHMRWADERVIGLLSQGPPLDDRTLALFAHVLAAERIWLDRLRGRSPLSVEVWPDLSLEECRQLLERNKEGYRHYLRDADLDATIRYRNSSGAEFETVARDILLHVSLHGSYHRGQIAMAIRQNGGQPVNTDFIAFVRDGH